MLLEVALIQVPEIHGGIGGEPARHRVQCAVIDSRSGQFRVQQSAAVEPAHADQPVDDIAVAAAEEESAGGSTGRGEWTFLRTMLSARFHGEIGVCPPLDMAGYYDIQIVG